MVNTRTIRLVAVLVLSAAVAASGQSPEFVTYTPAPPSADGGAVPVSLAKTMGDPVYATLYGGNGYDELLAESTWRDLVCFGGVTSSNNLTLLAPFQSTNAGGYDGWVSCASDTLAVPLFISYLGSTGAETVTDVLVIRDTLLAVGVTTSPSVPGAVNTYQTTSGGGQDCFISILNARDGSGLKTTLFGFDGDEYCSGIRADKNGIWIAGTTNKLIDLVNPIQSTVEGPSDGFIALLKRDLSGLRFSSLLGGDGADGIERIGLKSYNKHWNDEETEPYSDIARLIATGWTRSQNLPTTEDAFQKTHGGGLDGFHINIRYEYDTDLPSIDYMTYFGKAGDEVPRGMALSRRGATITGWTTSNGLNTLGRDRNAGTSDGFAYDYQLWADSIVTDFGYVGPSTTYNLPLAVATAPNGIIAIAGYALIPSAGTAFLAAYDRNFDQIGVQTVGTAAPADFNTLAINALAEELWRGGGKTSQPIQTTEDAFQSTYGGGDFDMFEAKYRTPWGYHQILNLTFDDMAYLRDDEADESIKARNARHTEMLSWGSEYTYRMTRPNKTYDFTRILDEDSHSMNFTYLLEDAALAVGVPKPEKGEIGIIGYNELQRAIDVIRLDQTVEHNEIKRTTVDAGQFFYLSLPRNQDIRIGDGFDIVDYRPPKNYYRNSFPYLSGMLQAKTASSNSVQSFEFVLFDSEGTPVELPITTATEETENIPERRGLFEAYPNPFVERTEIHFQLPAMGVVRMTVFDALGRKVATLLDAVRPEGTYTLDWDGSRNDGGRAASGLYLLLLETDGQTKARSVLLTR